MAMSKDFWKTSLIVVTLICIGIVSAANEVMPEILSLKFNNDMVRESDRVTLTCSVKNMDLRYTLYFLKQAKNPNNSSLMWYDLAHNTEPIYPGSGYEFTINEKGDYVMTIPNVKAAMSGNYSCKVQSTNLNFKVNVSRELSVLAKPALRLFIDGIEIQPQSTRFFSYSSTHNLQCISEGGNPSAALQVSHGNQDLSSKITNYNTSAPLYGTPAESQFPFLSAVTYSSSVMLRDWMVDVTYQGAPVTCRTRQTHNTVDDAAYQNSVSFIAFVDEGPPHIICNDTFVLPETAVDGFHVTCIVVSKPELRDAMFGCDSNLTCWDFNGFPMNDWHPKPDTVYSGIVTKLDTVDRSTSASVIKANMTLKLRMDRKALIGRKYTFKAWNDRGFVSHMVTLSNSAVTVATRTLSTIISGITLLHIALVLHNN